MMDACPAGGEQARGMAQGAGWARSSGVRLHTRTPPPAQAHTRLLESPYNSGRAALPPVGPQMSSPNSEVPAWGRSDGTEGKVLAFTSCQSSLAVRCWYRIGLTEFLQE